MEITAVWLTTRDLAPQWEFYATTLGLPLLASSSAAFTVRAGTTTLTFAQGDAAATYHVAFTIPRNKLAGAKGWLHGRAALLTQNGADEFSSQLWNAQQCYFRDPAGSILEFIARHNLDNDAPGPFVTDDILGVSEVGLPVDDVPTTVAALTRDLGLPPYQEQGASFSPVGDDRGLFIVVRRGRSWFPTDLTAAVHPLAVTIRGAWAQDYQVGDLPYRIAVMTE